MSDFLRKIPRNSNRARKRDIWDMSDMSDTPGVRIYTPIYDIGHMACMSDLSSEGLGEGTARYMRIYRVCVVCPIRGIQKRTYGITVTYRKTFRTYRKTYAAYRTPQGCYVPNVRFAILCPYVD
jgi:hypothetical protein